MKFVSRGMAGRKKTDSWKMMRGVALERTVTWFMSPCIFNDSLKCKIADLLLQ